jgi:predicted glycoside hydrolase/deacetylase ChbG (UPF0249 family)
VSWQETFTSSVADADAGKRARGMLIVNADDWGGWRSATDAALECFEAERITSVTAMVFMEDSERAARVAKKSGVDVGLHLNFNQEFTGSSIPPDTAQAHKRVRRFLGRNKYAQLFYNPCLRREFHLLFRAQLQEFSRLYGQSPSHFDGHQHMHLCANIVRDGLIPAGESVRRSFSFKKGEKSWLNRAYRSVIDRKLHRRYRVTDSFYSLEQCLKKGDINSVVQLATSNAVELMTHPEKSIEYHFLMSDPWNALMKRVKTCTYTQFQFGE